MTPVRAARSCPASVMRPKSKLPLTVSPSSHPYRPVHLFIVIMPPPFKMPHAHHPALPLVPAPVDLFKARVLDFKQWLTKRPESVIAMVAHWGLLEELTGGWVGRVMGGRMPEGQHPCSQ